MRSEALTTFREMANERFEEARRDVAAEKAVPRPNLAAPTLDEVVERIGREYARRRQQRLNDEGHWEGRLEPLDPELAWTDEGSSEEWRQEVRDEVLSYLDAGGLVKKQLRAIRGER